MSEQPWYRAPITALNRVTLRSAAIAIGPSDELAPPKLEEHVARELELQILAFPLWHRVGFRIGLVFLELGAALGAWGVLPFSWLSRAQAGARFEAMMHSALPPVRLFCHSLKMLVCLSAYGHPEVEERLGFPRRRWRESRVALHDKLVTISDARGRAPVPARSADVRWISEQAYLSDDASERVTDAGGAQDEQHDR